MNEKENLYMRSKVDAGGSVNNPDSRAGAKTLPVCQMFRHRFKSEGIFHSHTSAYSHINLRSVFVKLNRTYLK